MEITVGMATKRFKRSKEFGEKVANAVWHGMGSRDVRDCIKVIRLCNNATEIDTIMKALEEYSIENLDEEQQGEDDGTGEYLENNTNSNEREIEYKQ